MRNSKDKNIIKLILVFIIYFVVSKYLPNLLPKYGSLVNTLIKDFIIMILVILIYFKEIKKDFKKFKKSNHKWLLLIWTVGIMIAVYFINLLIAKYLPSLIKSGSTLNNSISYSSKYYAFFKLVIFASIVETIIYFMSFRKVFNNDIVYLIVSSIVYTFFNCIFLGFSLSVLLSAVLVRFIPSALYNFAYIKNDNNIVSLMVIIMITNTLSYFGITVGQFL